MKLKLKNILVYISMFLVLCVALIRPYLHSLFKINYVNLLMIITSIVLLTLHIILAKKIKLKGGKYLFIGFLLIIVSLYNNAYLQDGKYGEILIYYLSIIYFSLLVLSSNNFEINKVLKFSLNIIILFSIITSIVTWICFLFPDVYRSSVIPLLPVDSQPYILRTYRLVNPGLTNHYSRNAFYVVIGIISSFAFYKKENKKQNIMLISYNLFLLVTLYIIGKRGHLLFLVTSFFISFILYERISVKNIIKIFGTMMILIIFTFFILKAIPQANFVFSRFNDNSTDISTGRFDMYKDAWELFKNNNYFPIGWGQYSKSTNYYHPALHNDYIQLFVEVGLFGFIIVVGTNIYFLIKSVKYSISTKKMFGFTSIFYNIFFLTYSLTGLPHYDIETYIMYFLINSCMYILSLKETEMI